MIPKRPLLLDRTACVALALTFVLLWVVYGVPLTNLNFDSSFYYAHLTSPLIDGDLDFANNGLPAGLIGRTATGLTGSLWSAGPALLWAPFFVLAHVLTLVAQQLGVPIAADGVAPLYLTLVSLGSALWGLLGVLFCYALARRVAGPGPSLLAAAMVLLATPLFQYTMHTSLYAHASTVALLSAAMLAWWPLHDGSVVSWHWLLFGLLLGLAAAQRWQNALFALLTPFVWLPVLRVRPMRAVALGMLVVAGSLIGFAPQMAVWWRLYGQVLAFPQGPDFLHWTQPALVPLLLGSNRGLFVWEPAALLGLLGVALLCMRTPRAGVALLVIAALETYLNSIVNDWWGGGGFGPRRFDWFSPLLALGVATLAQPLWQQRTGRAAALLIGAALAVQQLALAQAHFYRTLPSGQAFPVAAYDAGEPLPGLVLAVLRQALARPAFLIETHPTLWTTASPLLFALPSLAHGGDQQIASLIAGLLAPLLALPVGWMVARRIAHGPAEPRLIRSVCCALIAVSLVASMIFLTI